MTFLKSALEMKPFTHLSTLVQSLHSRQFYPRAVFTLIFLHSVTFVALSDDDLPAWYQSWWFKSLVILVSLACFLNSLKFLSDKSKSEQQIRAKIACDLHDDLGNTLNCVSVYANLAMLEKGKNDYLDKIEEGTQEAMCSVRDLIWDLDESESCMGELLTRIDKYASFLCSSKNVRYKQYIMPEVSKYVLLPQERRNLHMICKEVISNAIKYSSAQEIKIEIFEHNLKPVICVTDDGKGFAPLGKFEGNGLNNIKFRAEQIGYKLCIESKPAKGVRIRLMKR